MAGPVPTHIRRALAVYEAAKALVASCIPGFDDVAKVVCCPRNKPTSWTVFVPKEGDQQAGVQHRSYLEGKLLVMLAGKVAAHVVLGEAYAGVVGKYGNDLEAANVIARQMVYQHGMSRYLGPLGLLGMSEEVDYVNVREDIVDKVKMADVSAQMASVALREIQALLDAAEARVKHVLVHNWDRLGDLVQALLTRQVLSAKEISELLARDGGLQMLSTAGLGDDEVSQKYGWVDGGPIQVPGPAARALFGQTPLAVKTVKLPRHRLLPGGGEGGNGNGRGEVEVEVHPEYPYELDGAKISASPGFSAEYVAEGALRPKTLTNEALRERQAGAPPGSSRG